MATSRCRSARLPEELRPNAKARTSFGRPAFIHVVLRNRSLLGVQMITAKPLRFAPKMILCPLEEHPIINIVGSFLPSLGRLLPTQLTHAQGADFVMKS